MSTFPKLGRDATVPDIFKMSPEASGSLMDLHETVMRGESPLTAGEREIIAAFVSGLNECRYCRGVHAKTAVAFGFEENIISDLLNDIDSADIDEKLKPLLSYSMKLTKKPSSITDSDGDAVFQAGWDELALHHTIMVTCIFNFMNRLLEGHGVKGNEKIFKIRGKMLKEHGYRHTIQNSMK